jgi:enoyl-CoA hydratase/carnithine racemase
MSIQTGTDGAVRTITLDNARRANSLTWEMLDQLVDALQQAGADESVRGVLLRASHDAGFSAGMDTSLFETDDPGRAYDIITRLGTFFQMPEVRIDIPSVLETVNLHRLMGWTLATELVLTADKYDAELMLQRGYLNRIDEDPETACLALLASTAESSRHVIAQQKRLNNRWRNLHEREAIDDTRNEFALAFTRRKR